MQIELCLISSLADVKELSKILRNQIKRFGPFIVSFEFGDDEIE
jgi:hypothetical protein